MLFSSSPNYTLNPGNSINDVAPYNVLSIYDIYQNNISNNKIKLIWQLISQSIPTGWDFSLCDYATCYPGLPSSGAMDSIDIGSMGFIGLNIDPYSIPGTAVVKIFVYEDGYFSLGDTLTWTINAVAAGISENEKQVDLNLFPNPVVKEMNVSVPAVKNGDSFNYKIFDGEGKLVSEGELDKEISVLSVDKFKSGIYYYVLLSGTKRKSVTKFIKSD